VKGCEKAVCSHPRLPAVGTRASPAWTQGVSVTASMVAPATHPYPQPSPAQPSPVESFTACFSGTWPFCSEVQVTLPLWPAMLSKAARRLSLSFLDALTKHHRLGGWGQKLMATLFLRPEVQEQGASRPGPPDSLPLACGWMDSSPACVWSKVLLLIWTQSCWVKVPGMASS
jgi:hypothetical protein